MQQAPLSHVHSAYVHRRAGPVCLRREGVAQAWGRRAGPMRLGLQPCVPQAATLCASRCNPMCLTLQPYVPEAATLF
eukprot:scaffold23591_cov58-Phaeocystis_antarctica.AAC.2